MLKFALAAATSCLLTVSLSAQSPEWDTFGAGCAGSGTGSICESLNAGTTGPLQGVSRLNQEWAFGVQVSQDTVILGMRLFTAASSSTSTAYVPCALYLDSGGAGTSTAAANAVACATMRVPGVTTPAWYEAYFDQPVAVTAGSNVWISQLGRNVAEVAMVQAGTAPTLSTLNRPAGSGRAWGFYTGAGFPAWELICSRGTARQTPAISYKETPVLGSTNFEVLLRHAAPAQPGVLMLGASNTTWLGLPLPFQSPVSPAGCNFLVSGELFLPIPGVPLTSADGTANWPLSVPNQANLLGKTLYNQWFNFDTTGWIASNAGSFTIGQ